MAKLSLCVRLALVLSIAAISGAWAQTIALQTTEYVSPMGDAVRLGAFGPLQGCSNPSQLVFGALPGSGPIIEVAVEQHVLHPGELVPLPRYADGSEAAETEVFWTAHIWEAKFAHWGNGRDPFPASISGAGDRITVSFSGRTYAGGYLIINPYAFPNFETRDIDVAVTVVAARRALATGVRASSWGGLKSGGR